MGMQCSDLEVGRVFSKLVMYDVYNIKSSRYRLICSLYAPMDSMYWFISHIILLSLARLTATFATQILPPYNSV